MRTAEAATDLRGFLGWLATQPDQLRARYGTTRSEWLRALEAGRNPFDEATLERLRQE